MAPESERAKCRWCGKSKSDHAYMYMCSHEFEPAHAAAENSPAPQETSAGQTNPNEPTLTCSEVVERLALECVKEVTFAHPEWSLFDRDKATAILDSWRERRVQELEERLRRTEALLASVRWAVTRAQDEEIGSFLGEQVK